ncbi:MAG TPA: DUF1641 domain-containing protein [Sandaracinaceae bacterium LLY-WYZ-13_1]|nr:DUF1641 domain-containing protein [Sandaracinaceae bacterium LLY-WYZ-13_1]
MSSGKGKDALSRIEARLERIESMLDRFERVTEQLPAGAAVAGDIFDEWAARDGHVDERLRALTSLLDRATKPEVLHALTVLVEQVEAAPGLVAMFVDIADELAAQAADQGVDLHELTSNLGRAARGVIMLASREEIRELLESDMFEPGALQTLSAAARSMSEARAGGDPERVGLFGTMGALRDPEVQRALAFAIRVAKGFGKTLDDSNGAAPKQLTAG